MPRKRRGFTLLEVLIAAGITAVIASFATASLVVSLRLKELKKQNNNVELQLQTVESVIGQDVANSVSAVGANLPYSLYTIPLTNPVFANSGLGSEINKYPSDSMLLMMTPRKDSNGNLTNLSDTRAYCARPILDNASNLIGKQLVRYLIDANIDPSNVTNLTCQPEIIKAKFGLANLPPYQILTSSTLQINYLRFAPLWNRVTVSTEFYDRNPPAVRMEMAARYNSNNGLINPVEQVRANASSSQSSQTFIQTVFSRCQNTDPSICY